MNVAGRPDERISSVIGSGGCVYRGMILDPDDDGDRQMLDRLSADPRIEVIDTREQQLQSLRRLLPKSAQNIDECPHRWVFYPWRRTVASILSESEFRALRLDRNRNLITPQEQAALGRMRVGVVGLSVGHSVAHVLAAEGIVGELRLADFDDIELSNLNRVPASVVDLSVNKAVVAARRIAELDPYLTVHVVDSGVTEESIDAFLDGLDVVVEECDSLDVKVLVREAARARGLPVLMATSDRGLVDVERYDHDPARPVLHGLIGDATKAELTAMSSDDKVPYVLRILDGAHLSPRLAASMVEVSQTLSTWPQRASEVNLGASVIAEAVRRIGLEEHLPSGRIRVDIAELLHCLDDPAAQSDTPSPVARVDAPRWEHSRPCDVVAAAAARAPSGGNVQPWSILVRPESVTLGLSPEHTTTMDVGLRGSAVALGAAVLNARIAASTLGVLGLVEIDEHPNDATPLRAVVHLDGGTDSVEPELARLYQPMMERATNRHHGTPIPLTADAIDALSSAAHGEGASLRLLNTRDEIYRASTILARSDRIRFLTPTLHNEMFSELRWEGDDIEVGLDVRTLELSDSDRAKLDVLRRADVMRQLARWDAGAGLGKDMAERVCASAAVGVVCVRGEKRLIDYARGGAAVEAVWIAAQQRHIGVQPVSPPFLYAHNERDLRDLSPRFVAQLQELQTEFRRLTLTRDDEAQILILRFSSAPAPSVRSRRSLARVVRVS